jgi:hypothetical protein
MYIQLPLNFAQSAKFKSLSRIFDSENRSFNMSHQDRFVWMTIIIGTLASLIQIAL